MLYGLYQSAMGADLQALKMDTVSNNIANASTSTFKRDLAVFAVRRQQAEMDGAPNSIPPGMRGHAGSPVTVETHTDFSQGSLDQTGSPLDAALAGPGFFRVTDGERDYLTRRGSFAVNSESELVEADTGLSVLDDRGEPIVVPPGSELQFSELGAIAAIDPVTRQSIPLGRFDLVEPSDYRYLKKEGDSLYTAPEEMLDSTGPELSVRQGYREASGVRPVHEMLSMIETSRAFEANMKLVQHQEQALGQLLQAVGRG